MNTKTTGRNPSHFQKGSGCYTCRSCNKRTRSTGSATSSRDAVETAFDLTKESGRGTWVSIARRAPSRVSRWVDDDSDDEAGIENEHQDGYHKEYRDDCPMCREDAECRKVAS